MKQKIIIFMFLFFGGFFCFYNNVDATWTCSPDGHSCFGQPPPVGVGGGGGGSSHTPPPPPTFSYSGHAASTPCGVRLKLGQIPLGVKPYVTYTSTTDHTFNITRREIGTNVYAYFTNIKISHVVVQEGYSAGGSPYYYGAYYFTDLTAVPGKQYSYSFYETSLGYDSYRTYSITFSRPELYFNANGTGYRNLFPPDSFGWGYRNQGSEPFSNACPFVQNPGSGISMFSSVPAGYLSGYSHANSTSLNFYSPGDSLGGQISDLSCSKNKYAYAVSKPSGQEQVSFSYVDSNNNNSDEIGQIYGINSDKLVKSIGKTGGYYSIYKTAAVSYNFYREICDQDAYDWTLDSCSQQKLTNSDYTTEQLKTGFFIINFDQNYTPPTGKEIRNYYVTSVNQYGAESWPFAFASYYPVPTCSNNCLDPNTLSATTTFNFKNLVTEKVLSWNNTNSELIQSIYNASSSDQEWYIKPTNEIRYANIVSKTDNKSLATSGSIDWSWNHYFNSSDTFDYGGWPGYIQNALGYYDYFYYNNVAGTGYKVIKKTPAQNDDSQKWCVSPVNQDVYDENGNLTGQTLMGYSLINKGTQNALMPFFSADWTPFSDDGSLVWLDLSTGGYVGGSYTNSYTPGYYGFQDIWQTSDINTPQSCPLPDGITTIPDAVTATYYKLDHVNGNCDDSSNVETRTCTNGALTGSATSTSCTEYCVNPTNGDDIYLNNAYSTTTEANCVNYQTTYTCGDNGLFTQTGIISTPVTGCTHTTNAPVSKKLNLARLVPSIVDLGYQCKGKVDTGEMTNSNNNLNLSTTTCYIYQVLADGTTASSKYSSGDPMSSASSSWPGVDPGKDYKIVCKDNAIPNYVTAISQTLKCALNPVVREI